MDRPPLPEPRSGWVADDHHMTWYDADQMHAYAAAVSAADNAALREALENLVTTHDQLNAIFCLASAVTKEENARFIELSSRYPNDWIAARAALKGASHE